MKKKSQPTTDPLTQVRKICLALPQAVETETWGEPHFRVANKIFAGFGDEDGIPTLGFKLEMDHAAQVVKIPGFRKAKYVGHKGWVSMDARDVKDWQTVEEMIHESYRLIAPKRLAAALAGDDSDGQPAAKSKRARSSRAKATTKKAPIKKKASQKDAKKRVAKKKAVKKKASKKKAVKASLKRVVKKKVARRSLAKRKRSS